MREGGVDKYKVILPSFIVQVHCLIWLDRYAVGWPVWQAVIGRWERRQVKKQHPVSSLGADVRTQGFTKTT